MRFPTDSLARRVLISLAVLAAAGVMSVLYLAFRPADAGGAQSRGALGELGRSGALVRTFAPRLSQQVSFRKCPAPSAPGATVPRAECGGDPVLRPAAVFELSMRAAREVRESASPQALHASALIDLVWSDTAGIPLDRSISSLQTAARVSEKPAAALADLAAAHLVRAGRTQNVRDLLEAIDVAERSLAAEPRNAAALFNLALALEWLGVDGQAQVAWRDFLAADSISGWADEARGHLRARREWTAPNPPAPGAPPAEIAGYAAQAPQEARVHGWNVALGEWGSALLRRDVHRARESLRTAELLGRELERRGGDATLADAVRAIQAARADTAATRTLAEAHRAFATGQAAFGAAEFAAAGEHFERIAALRPPSPSLRRWAGRMLATTMMATARMQEAEQLLEALVTETDTLRYPALAGHQQWALATTLLRRGRYQGALDAAQRAERLLERANEREGAGGARYVMADVEYALGASTAVYASVHRALLTLRPYRHSVWRGNVLASGARAAASEGLTRAAVRLQDERIAVAESAGRIMHLAEARIARAEMRRVVGDESGAAADIRAGEALAQRVSAPAARSWLAADLQLARAHGSVGREPRMAAAALDTVIAVSNGSRPAIRRLQALVARAGARLELGDRDGATEDLNRAAVLIEEQRGALASAPLRASLLDAARAVFDRLVMLRVAAGDTLGALAYLEKGRTSVNSTVAHSAREPFRPRMQPGRVAVAYALIGDTLLTWTVSRDAVRLNRATVRRNDLVRRVVRVQSGLEFRARESTVRRDLETLYDDLLRPIEARLGRPGTEMVVVADGEIAGVPFAALRDSGRGRYLVESHPSSFAGTLRDALRVREARVAGNGVLLVADPAFDARDHPGLRRLRGARAEIESLRNGVYPSATVLVGSAATPDAVVRAIGASGIIHFAGHAAFDDLRPERSYLVLARNGADGGALTASDLADMKLDGARLVVLSACQTLRPGKGRSGGFAGFASALVGAGAGGVVGSLWRVDDQHARELMSAFHRRYQQLEEAPRALRDAQLQMLQSSDPALRSPAAWAGYRYAGR